MGGLTPGRAVALSVLRRTFEDGEYTERAFREEAERAGLDRRQRALSQFLSFGAVQRKGTSDQIVRDFSRNRGSRPGPVTAGALRLALFEIFFSRSPAEHAVVDQAVSAVKESDESRAGGFVNAVLRRAIRERAGIEDRLGRTGSAEELAFASSLPLWLSRMWCEELGPERARSVAAAVNLPPERCVLLNPERIEALGLDPSVVIERLQAGTGPVNEGDGDGIEVSPADGPWPLAPKWLFTVTGSLAPAERVAADGLLTILSRGSAAVVEALGPEPGERALDLCAGPGTKTGLIAGRVGRYGNVVAVEPEPARADDVAERVERLGFHNTLVVEADGRETEILADFERVLVDAPCSDLGALASRPDARWRKGPDVIERLTGLQADLLDRAGSLLSPGGTLVYSTCTISRRENRDQAIGFAARSGFEIDDLGRLAPGLADTSDARFLQILPDRDRTTGFFIARFRSRQLPGESG
jgi:16S rRNA (cytosine967-C5)-methyltransferase